MAARSMKIRSLKVFALALGLAMAPIAHPAPPPVVQQEISHLIQFIGVSGCEFKRYGAWNNAKAAEDHVRGKYNWLEKMGMVDTTNDFIVKAATQSYFSGEPYEIKCGGNLPVSSSLWLNTELARYRVSQAEPPDKAGTR